MSFTIVKKNSCFIDNCVFKEWGSRETIPLFFDASMQFFTTERRKSATRAPQERQNT